MNKRGRKRIGKEKQTEQGRLGKGDGSADDNLREEDADVTGQKKKPR